MRGPEPLTLTLELARAAKADSAEAFVFAPQSYVLRGPGGGFHNATLPWNEALLSDLVAVRQPGRDPVVVQRLGERLRDFLASTEWPVTEDKIRTAVGTRRPVFMTIRSGAAELYALPWELLTIEASGQHIGELPGVLVRYEWPDTQTRSQPADVDGMRLLFAWSGAVPAVEHQTAIHAACEAGKQPFDTERDVLAHASCGRLSEKLKAATDEGRPVRILHLLCHGTATGSTFGLALDGDEPDDGAVAVDAGRLRQILAPHADTLRVVVLAACDGGNVGAVGNQLGSVAQALHRIGIAAVIASRYPLSTSGSNRLACTLYKTLLGGQATLEEAFIAARQHLAEDATQLDWASLQLYARAGDGNATSPAGRVSVENLRAPQVREELSQFRALFTGTRSQIALLGQYKALHDVLQEVEAPFSAIVRDQKRLQASREAWDELCDPLGSLQLLLEKSLAILAGERLCDEFDVTRRRLTDALASLVAAIAGESKKLDGAVLHVRRVLGLDMSTANNRLLTTARDLRLDAVVAALRSVLSSLGAGRGTGASIDELARLVGALDELNTRLDALVREHDQWQAIGNDLRHFVDSGQPGLDETRHSWPPVQDSLAAVLKEGNGADWTRVIDTAARELDGALDRNDDPCKCVANLRGLFRRANHRFVEVDKALLRTCEELRQVGDTLDSVLKVIDEQ
jgi:hypothetical protein